MTKKELKMYKDIAKTDSCYTTYNCNKCKVIRCYVKNDSIEWQDDKRNLDAKIILDNYYRIEKIKKIIGD